MGGFSLSDLPLASFQGGSGEVRLAGEEVGAAAVFEGRVRRDSHLRPVTALEYEAHPTLAQDVGEQIVKEAVRRFELTDAECIHRVGKVPVGGIAIRAVCFSGHRKAAFRACEWIVDEVKAKVQIWKKEVFEDGESEWSIPEPPVTAEELNRRQVSLPVIGPGGQELLRTSKVVVVGAGGLGAIIVRLLAGAGVGEIKIIDFDKVSASDLHRQVTYSVHDIGLPKASVLALQAEAANPFTKAMPVLDWLTGANAEKHLKGADLVIDGVDTFLGKFTVSDACAELGIPCISGALSQLQGQVMMMQPGGPCLRCLWPHEPQDGDIGTCAEGGVIGSIPNLVGSIIAGEAIRFLAQAGPSLEPGTLLLVDGADLEIRKLKVSVNPHCRCQKHQRAAAKAKVTEPVEVKASDWSELQSWAVVDIREPEEAALNPLPLEASVNMPLSRFYAPDLPQADRYLLVCGHGIRSLQVAKSLRRSGDRRFYSLSGGVALISQTPAVSKG